MEDLKQRKKKMNEMRQIDKNNIFKKMCSYNYSLNTNNYFLFIMSRKFYIVSVLYINPPPPPSG